MNKKLPLNKSDMNDNHKAFMTFAEIDSSGKKSFTGKYTVSAEDYEKLTTLAKRSYSAESEAQRLREENGRSVPSNMVAAKRGFKVKNCAAGIDRKVQTVP